MFEFKTAESVQNVEENLLNLQSITQGQNVNLHKKNPYAHNYEGNSEGNFSSPTAKLASKANTIQ